MNSSGNFLIDVESVTTALGYIYFFLLILGGPIVLTVMNIYYAVKLSKKIKAGEEDQKMLSSSRVTAILTFVIGFILSGIYLALSDVTSAEWYEAVYVFEEHTPISGDHELTIEVFSFLAIIGYLILEYTQMTKMPPLLYALASAMLYMGIVIVVLWAVQTGFSIFLPLYSFNLCLIAASLIYRKSLEFQRISHQKKLHFLEKNFSLFGLILLAPFFAAVTAFLLIFGQDFDSIIKAWTETSDWVLSAKQAPPPLDYDGHYLCTVAAEGHKKIVKPLRDGQRQNYRITVNRQLCVANAFEQILEEKTPHFHRVIRHFYDTHGLPLAKMIKTKFSADLIYLLMKPLEWLFLIILYLTDPKPEKRIALQYLPQKEKQELAALIESQV